MLSITPPAPPPMNVIFIALLSPPGTVIAT